METVNSVPTNLASNEPFKELLLHVGMGYAIAFGLTYLTNNRQISFLVPAINNENKTITTIPITLPLISLVNNLLAFSLMAGGIAAGSTGHLALAEPLFSLGMGAFIETNL